MKEIKEISNLLTRLYSIELVINHIQSFTNINALLDTNKEYRGKKRDYVYVSDVAEAFIKSALNESKSHIFNIGSGNPISINKLIKILVGDKYKIVKLPNRPGEPHVTCANISRAKKELRWSPKVTFEKGVNEMLNNIEYLLLIVLIVSSTAEGDVNVQNNLFKIFSVDISKINMSEYSKTTLRITFHRFIVYSFFSFNWVFHNFFNFL